MRRRLTRLRARLEFKERERKEGCVMQVRCRGVWRQSRGRGGKGGKGGESVMEA